MSQLLFKEILRIKKIFIIFVLLLDCSSSQTFKKIVKIEEGIGNFYLVRAANPFMSLYRYKILLYKYKGNFKSDPNPEEFKKINIGVGEYCYLKLEQGFYKIELEDDSSTQKIFFIEKGKEYFYEFYIFSESEFSGADYFIREIKKADALDLLLDGKRHLTKHKLSED